MGIFSKTKKPEINLPNHTLRSSYGIIDCPKCARYIHVKYHSGCSDLDRQHLHCICDCGYEFTNTPNDNDKVKFQRC